MSFNSLFKAIKYSLVGAITKVAVLAFLLVTSIFVTTVHAQTSDAATNAVSKELTPVARPLFLTSPNTSLRPKLRGSTSEAEQTTAPVAVDIAPELPVPVETVLEVQSEETETTEQTTEAAEASATTSETNTVVAADIETINTPVAPADPNLKAVKPLLRGGEPSSAPLPETGDLAVSTQTENDPQNADEATASVSEENPETQEVAVAPADPNLRSLRPQRRPSAVQDIAKITSTAPAKAAHKSLKPKRKSATLFAAPSPNPKPVEPPKPEKDPALTKLQIELAIREAEEAKRQAALRNASRLAVAISAFPQKKSSRFNGIVNRTKSNIRKASLTSPSETDERPGSPSTTFKKGKISLVGVFGTSSSRRALIRTSGGRYVKVKRGQNVSGWRVSAIGESTVRITRGARSRTLRLP